MLDVPFDTAPESAAGRLGDGKDILASDTVPFAIWCAAGSPDDYKEALWRAASTPARPHIVPTLRRSLSASV